MKRFGLLITFLLLASPQFAAAAGLLPTATRTATASSSASSSVKPTTSPSPQLSPSSKPTLTPTAASSPKQQTTEPTAHLLSAEPVTHPVPIQNQAAVSSIEPNLAADATLAPANVQDWADIAAGKANHNALLPTDATVLDGSRKLLVEAATGQAVENSQQIRQAVSTAAAPGGSIIQSQPINDDAFAILALRSTGSESSDSNLLNLAAHIMTTQHADGGFAWDVSSPSDTNTTALVIQALKSLVGIGGQADSVARARQFLVMAQNSDGCFPYYPGGQSDADSTAWVLSTITGSLGEQPSSWTKQTDPESCLKTFIQPDGRVRHSQTGEPSVLSAAYTDLALKHQSFLFQQPTPQAPAQNSLPVPAEEHISTILSENHTFSSEPSIAEATAVKTVSAEPIQSVSKLLPALPPQTASSDSQSPSPGHPEAKQSPATSSDSAPNWPAYLFASLAGVSLILFALSFWQRRARW